MARFRWRQGDRKGRWCATRREALNLAFECRRAARVPAMGQVRFFEDVILEEDPRDALY